MIGEHILQKVHKQFDEGYSWAGDAGSQYASGGIDTNQFKHIIMVGMGGSSVIGDLLVNLSEELENPLPVILHRDYGLPIAPFREKALVIISSYSGTTQEAIHAYETAIRMKLPVVVVSSGGELTKKAEADLVPIAFIKNCNLPPRNSVGYQFGALLRILENINIIPCQKNTLSALQKEVKEYSHTAQQQGKELEQHIKNTVPLIFASAKYTSVAYMMQSLINESANSPAFSGVIPETNHNILMGYDQMNPKHFHTILIQGHDDDDKIKKRQQGMVQAIQEHKGTVSMLPLQGSNVHARIFNGIMVSNWLALHLAEQKKVDPITIPILTKFKSKMD